MTKQEFTARTSKPVSDKDYEIIEYVYTYHPSIDPVKGKDQIANLYETFGMRIIIDMLPTAEKAKHYEDEIRAAKLKLDRIKNEYEAIRECK